MHDPAFYATGSWQPFAGKEAAFVGAWTEFSSWAATQPGAAGRASLARDLRVPEQYASFMPWESLDAIRAWKAHGEFKERMARVQVFVDTFAASEIEVVARAHDPS